MLLQLRHLVIALLVYTLLLGANTAGHRHASAAESVPIATLSVLSHPVSVTSLDGLERPAHSGQLVSVGQVVRTASEGQALLTFFDGSSAELGPGAILSLEHAQRGPSGQTVLWLWQASGQVIHRVAQLLNGSAYEVHTPSAVGLVRGTVFRTSVDRRLGSAQVELFRGAMEVSGRVGQPVSLQPGQATEVQNWRAPRPPRPIMEPTPAEAPPLQVPPPPGPPPDSVLVGPSTSPAPASEPLKALLEQAIQTTDGAAGDFTWAEVGGLLDTPDDRPGQGASGREDGPTGAPGGEKDEQASPGPAGRTPLGNGARVSSGQAGGQLPNMVAEPLKPSSAPAIPQQKDNQPSEQTAASMPKQDTSPSGQSGTQSPGSAEQAAMGPPGKGNPASLPGDQAAQPGSEHASGGAKLPDLPPKVDQPPKGEASLKGELR